MHSCGEVVISSSPIRYTANGILRRLDISLVVVQVEVDHLFCVAVFDDPPFQRGFHFFLLDNQAYMIWYLESWIMSRLRACVRPFVGSAVARF